MPADEDTAPVRKRPSHLALKLIALVAVLVAAISLALTLAIHDGGRVVDNEAGAQCDDPDRSASTVALALTDDPCRAQSIVKSFAARGQLDDARRAVIWNGICAVLAAGALLAAASLELKSIRLRAAALVVMVMTVLALALALFENIWLYLALSDSPGDALGADWVSRVAYAAHLKWPLGIGAALFGVYAVAHWARGATPLPEPPVPELPRTIAANAGIPFQATPDDQRSPGKKWQQWVRGKSWQPKVPPPAPPQSKPDTIGICCSGGGVRSAAFNLGALQALQEAGRYQDASYLAAVSGGSYIASAFAVVANQSPEGAVTQAEPPFARGSAEEQYLRNHSSYLAAGVAGKLALGWRMLRGLAVNLILLGMLILIVALPIGWIIDNGQDDGGIPAHSRIVLADDDAFVNTLTGEPSSGDSAPAFTVYAAEGSRVALASGEVYALRRSSVVQVSAGSILDLVSGQRVFTKAADNPGEVALPALATRSLASSIRHPRTVVLSETRLRPQDGTALRLASGPPHTVVDKDTVLLGEGSRLALDQPTRLAVGEDTVIDADTGEVIDVCGSQRCVDHGVGPVIRWSVFAIAALGMLLALVPLLFRPNEEWTQSLETWGARLLMFAAFGAVVGIALPELIEWLRDQEGQPGFELSRISVSGIFAVVVAVALDLTGARGASIAATTQTLSKFRSAVANAGPKVRNAIVSVVGALIGPLAIVAAFLAVVVWGATRGVTLFQATVVVSAIVGVALLETTGDLIRWSMHPFYKRRLRSAFALRRTRRARGREAAAPVEYDTPIPLSTLQRVNGDVVGPELVVCAAANLSNPGAAPPGRPVSTFTFSSTHVGGGWLGLLDPSALERAAGGEYARDVTLPAAVAMSGAAVSPSMGKFTKRRYTFLLALANVRLGVWLPNPYRVRATVEQERDARTKEQGEERSNMLSRATASSEMGRAAAKPWTRQTVARPHYLFKEMFGFTSFRDPFVYVTDGGHFENLGLVELLRRGCTHIYCFDASGGDVDSFAALGQAIAIARSELEVEIDIDPKGHADDSAEGGDDGPAGVHCGAIRYQGEPTTSPLVFVRATVDDGAPWDVRAYRERDPRFPTHSTLDQLYTDEKFEAYRALGHYQATKAMEAMDADLAHRRREERKSAAPDEPRR